MGTRSSTFAAKVNKRQKEVYEKGLAGLEKKKLYTGTTTAVHEAYMEQVKRTQEQQQSAFEFYKHTCAEFWKKRAHEFVDVDALRETARRAMLDTRKHEILINDESNLIKTDIKSYGFREKRHGKMLRAQGVSTDTLQVAAPKPEGEEEARK